MKRYDSVPSSSGFEQLVFSGGGARCFWQGGFLSAVRETLPLRPKRICSVSGGALAASCFVADRERELLEQMGDAFAELDSNFRPENLVRRADIMPHQDLYRRVVSMVLDRDAVEAVADGPVFQVLISKPPSEQMPVATTLLAGLACVRRTNPLRQTVTPDRKPLEYVCFVMSSVLLISQTFAPLLRTTCT